MATYTNAVLQALQHFHSICCMNSFPINTFLLKTSTQFKELLFFQPWYAMSKCNFVSICSFHVSDVKITNNSVKKKKLNISKKLDACLQVSEEHRRMTLLLLSLYFSCKPALNFSPLLLGDLFEGFQHLQGFFKFKISSRHSTEESESVSQALSGEKRSRCCTVSVAKAVQHNRSPNLSNDCIILQNNSV